MAKGVLLLGIGLGVFRLINADLSLLVHRIAWQLRIDPENRYVQLLIERVGHIPPRSLRNLGLLSILFSADLFVEGIGLWLNRTWAKYLVLIATGVPIPAEAYACLRHGNLTRVVFLIVNIAVVATIASYLLTQRRDRKLASGS